MSEKSKPKCAHCGKPAQPHERNSDGTYLHTHCAMILAGSGNLQK